MNNRTLLLIGLVVFLYFYTKNKNNSEEDIIEEYEEEPMDEETMNEPIVQQNIITKPDIEPDSMIPPPEMKSSKCGSFVSSDLLPKPSRQDDFSEYSPSQGVDSNFLDGSRFLSMTTSLLRNSNLQIRPEPEVPREDVCPWNQSTIYRENTEAGKFREGGLY